MPHPVLAGLLGFIPGVGAMYNGQYVKALAHVLIFGVFVSLSDHELSLRLVARCAWVFYQVFDAAQTAKARRDGTPLPNPFGLNDLGARLGMSPTPGASPYVAGYSAPAQRAAQPPVDAWFDCRVRIPDQPRVRPIFLSVIRLPIPRPTPCPRPRRRPATPVP